MDQLILTNGQIALGTASALGDDRYHFEGSTESTATLDQGDQVVLEGPSVPCRHMRIADRGPLLPEMRRRDARVYFYADLEPSPL